MLLSVPVATSRAVTQTSRRLAKVAAIAEVLRQASPEEVPLVVTWLSGQMRQTRPGVGYAAIRSATAVPAEASTLSISEVDAILDAIAGSQGRGSESRRHELLRDLFRRATEPEQQFLIGLITGELRQGALEGLMIEAVAKAYDLPPERVRRAAMLAGDIARVAQSIAERGSAALDEYSIRLFRPVQPMLAQTAETVSDALRDLGETALEWKLDGARVQVHRSGEEVRVYTRNLNDVTPAVPEIVEHVRALPDRELILDGEVISLLPDGRPQPFQITMRRFGRRLDVERLRGDIPLQPFWFDLLYADGGPVIDAPQRERFSAMQAIVPSSAVTPNLITADTEAAMHFVDDAVERGHEGVMAKAPDAPYAAGARGQSWLKVKQARTLDLVILAAEWGSGRRQGFLSNLHLGARDTANGAFVMLGKTFKGLTDEMLAWQTQELLKLEVARDHYTVYVEPKIVVEIAFNEIQASSRYPGGLALRFARVKRYRTDKPAAAADTIETVQSIAVSLGISI